MKRVPRESRRDRIAQWLAGIGVVILLASVVGNVALGYWYHQSSASSQHALAQKDQQILKLQHATKADAAQAAAALQWANAIDIDLTNICHEFATTCATFPNFAALTSPSGASGSSESSGTSRTTGTTTPPRRSGTTRPTTTTTTMTPRAVTTTTKPCAAHNPNCGSLPPQNACCA